jgi:hypothetical protein
MRFLGLGAITVLVTLATWRGCTCSVPPFRRASIELLHALYVSRLTAALRNESCTPEVSPALCETSANRFRRTRRSRHDMSTSSLRVDVPAAAKCVKRRSKGVGRPGPAHLHMHTCAWLATQALTSHTTSKQSTRLEHCFARVCRAEAQGTKISPTDAAPAHDQLQSEFAGLFSPSAFKFDLPLCVSLAGSAFEAYFKVCHARTDSPRMYAAAVTFL